MIVHDTIQTVIDRFVEGRIAPLRKRLDALAAKECPSIEWARVLEDRLGQLDVQVNGGVFVSSRPPEPEKNVPGPKYRTPCRIADDMGFEEEAERAEQRCYTGPTPGKFYYWNGSRCLMSEQAIVRVVREGPSPEEQEPDDPFAAGKWVECVEGYANTLVKGKKYKVLRYTSTIEDTVELEELPNKGWLVTRFRPCVLSTDECASREKAERLVDPPPEECTCDVRKREEEFKLIWWDSQRQQMFRWLVDGYKNEYFVCIHCTLPIRKSLKEKSNR